MKITIYTQDCFGCPFCNRFASSEESPFCWRAEKSLEPLDGEVPEDFDYQENIAPFCPINK